MATLAANGWRVVMATLFTASVPDPRGFALACQLDKGLPAEIDYMDLRRAEDLWAARALGEVEALHLPFREAPHRGYGSAPELFSDTRPDDSIVADITPALAALVAASAPDLILAPQAVGGHVDHVQTVRALRPIVEGRPVLWWRDFPYTVRHPDPKEPLREMVSGLRIREIALGETAQARKAAACAAYATQLGFQFGGPEGLAARLREENGVERFRAEGRVPDGVPGTDAG